MNAIAVSDVQFQGSAERLGSLKGSPANRQPIAASIEGGDKQSSTPGMDPRDVEQATDGVNAFLKSNGSHVQFSYNKDAKRMTVEVIDNRTQEVVKTIPSKEMLDLATRIDEMVGFILDKKG